MVNRIFTVKHGRVSSWWLKSHWLFVRFLNSQCAVASSVRRILKRGRGGRNFRKFERNINQNLKLSYSNFVPFFAQNQVISSPKPDTQLAKGEGHASILLTFLCNFAILATQRGATMAQWPPHKYAPGCCDTFTLFSIEAEQCTRCSRPAWQKLANITRKRMLRVGVVKQEQSAWFIYTNERTVFNGYCSLHIRSNGNNSQVYFIFWVITFFFSKN